MRRRIIPAPHPSRAPAPEGWVAVPGDPLTLRPVGEPDAAAVARLHRWVAAKPSGGAERLEVQTRDANGRATAVAPTPINGGPDCPREEKTMVKERTQDELVAAYAARCRAEEQAAERPREIAASAGGGDSEMSPEILAEATWARMRHVEAKAGTPESAYAHGVSPARLEAGPAVVDGAPAEGVASRLATSGTGREVFTFDGFIPAAEAQRRGVTAFESAAATRFAQGQGQGTGLGRALAASRPSALGALGIS